MFLCQAVYRFFDSSNCHTVCVFCLIVCPPNRTGPDRISMEAPKRWKKLKLREPTLSSRRLRGKQQQPTVNAAPAKREAHIELEGAPAKSSKMLRGKQAATTVKAAPAKMSKRWGIGVLTCPASSNNSEGGTGKDVQCQLVIVVSPASAQLSQCLSCRIAMRHVLG